MRHAAVLSALLLVGCAGSHAPAAPVPALACRALLSAARAPAPWDSLLWNRLEGAWTLTLWRPQIGAASRGPASLERHVPYGSKGEGLEGSHGVEYTPLHLAPGDGSLALFQVSGDTLWLRIGSPWLNHGTSLFGAGVLRGDTLSGCWHFGDEVQADTGWFRFSDHRGGTAAT